MDERPDAAILAQHLHLDVLHVALGIVVGVGVHGGKHGIDGHLHGLARVHIVDVVGVQVLVYIGENLQILGNLKTFVVLGRGTKGQSDEQ